MRTLVKLFCCLLCSVLVLSGFLSKSLDVSADDRVVTYTQITRSAGIDIFGSMLPYTVTYNGVSTSGNFVLSDKLVDNCQSINISNNSVFNSTSQVLQYDWLIYDASGVIPSQGYADIDIGVPVYFSDSARGAFLLSNYNINGNVLEGGVTINAYMSTNNNRNTYPFNYLFNELSNTEYKAPSLNTGASSNLSNYYAYMRLDYTDSGVSGNTYFRPAIYDVTGGCQFLTVHFERVRSNTDGSFSFAIACPYVYGDISAGNSQTTVTTVTTDGQQEINISVNINMDDTNSRLDGIAGDVQSVKDTLEGDESSYPDFTTIRALETYPITFDDSVVDDGLQAFDDVPDELAAGGFWFKLVYDLLHLSPLWLLLPLLIGLALARYVLWRG